MASSTWSTAGPTETLAGSIRAPIRRLSETGPRKRTGMEIDDLITPESVIARLRAHQQEAGAAGAREARRRDRPGCTSARSSTCCWSASGSAPPASATASPSRTASWPSCTASTACSRGSRRPVDFDAIDDQPVDLIFLLLAPESAGADHLKALARVSRLLRDRSICEKLRGADKADALYALLTDRAPATPPDLHCRLTGSRSFWRMVARAASRVGRTPIWVPSAAKTA